MQPLKAVEEVNENQKSILFQKISKLLQRRFKKQKPLQFGGYLLSQIPMI